jgi:hypothetical protein
MPSNHNVATSSDPPPPPPDEDDEEDDEDEEEEEGEGEPGVGPEVTGVPHGVLPAVAGADVDARADSISTCAVSERPWLSVTVSCRVTDPLAGAGTVAVAVFAPPIAGGLELGATTVQE